jgi:hypothetical protein
MLDRERVGFACLYHDTLNSNNLIYIEASLLRPHLISGEIMKTVFAALSLLFVSQVCLAQTVAYENLPHFLDLVQPGEYRINCARGKSYPNQGISVAVHDYTNAQVKKAGPQVTVELQGPAVSSLSFHFSRNNTKVSKTNKLSNDDGNILMPSEREVVTIEQKSAPYMAQIIQMTVTKLGLFSTNTHVLHTIFEDNAETPLQLTIRDSDSEGEETACRFFKQ